MLTPEQKEENLIRFFKTIYPNKQFDRNSKVNPAQETRIRDIAYSNDMGAYDRLEKWAQKKLSTPAQPKATLIKMEPPSKRQEYDEVVKTFKPQFGNMGHIRLLDMIGKETKLRNHIDALAKKRGQLEKAIQNAGKSQSSLTTLQTQVIAAIKASYAPPKSND